MAERLPYLYERAIANGIANALGWLNARSVRGATTGRYCCLPIKGGDTFAGGLSSGDLPLLLIGTATDGTGLIPEFLVAQHCALGAQVSQGAIGLTLFQGRLGCNQGIRVITGQYIGPRGGTHQHQYQQCRQYRNGSQVQAYKK